MYLEPAMEVVFQRQVPYWSLLRGATAKMLIIVVDYQLGSPLRRGVSHIDRQTGKHTHRHKHIES